MTDPELNYSKEQIEAINTLDQNLQIIACAGSGKTQVISERIVKLLKKPGIVPQNIVAFTYTEKAAAELKTRVLSLCKKHLPNLNGLADMYIGTIHGWCLKTLQDHIYEYQKFSILDEVKLKLFVNRNFNKIGMKDLGMEIYYDTSRFIQLMGILRESELTTPKNEIPEEIRTALLNYENTLTEASYFDFTMIMSKTYQSFLENENFTKKLKNQIKYLIVDEYQDVNPIQELIINSIVNLNANICVVGDDDQTIYQWRGGNIKYIIEFQKRYRNVKQVKLTDNYRSSPSIVELATNLIQLNQNRLPKQMVAKSTQIYEQGDLLYNDYNEVEGENQFIADQIKKLRGLQFTEKGITRGLDYSDFVILLRKWKKAENIIKILEENNIPFIVSGVNELLDRPEVKAAIGIFNYLSELIDSSVLIDSWTSLSSKIELKNINEAIKYLDKMKPQKVNYYGEFVIQEIYLNFLEISKITEEIFTQNTSRARAGNQSSEVIFYNLGMFSKLIDDFESIHFMSKPPNKLKNFLSFLKYEANEVYSEGWLNNDYKTPNAVQVMTIYQSKGLEYPVVFVPGLNKNYLPSQKRGGKNVWHHLPKELIQEQERYEGGIEDERRLFYVAITRAQKCLFLTRAPDGRNQGKESQFIEEISHSDYIFSNKDRTYTDRVFSDPRPKNDFESILLNFSVLKNFFDCPYQFKLVSMYGFHSPLSIRLGYGKSVHNVLMEIHKNALDGHETNRDEISILLDKHVHIPYAYPDVIEDIKDKASKVVQEYLKINQKGFKDIQFSEKEIQIDLGNGILINGRIDLIKKKDIDGKIKTTIIDFKSAEDSQKYDVSMEQLSLYAIGYQELSGEKADFLQIYNMDKNKPETQEIQIKDLDTMKRKIINAAESIKSNDLPKTKIKKKCEDCRQKKVCSGAT
jgi:DNA helicase II / ATP-dependent DNA helicase PcrA